MTITTTHGDMDPDTLRKTSGADETDAQLTEWVEYHLGDELVHRSVHVTLKQWPEGMSAIAGMIG